MEFFIKKIFERKTDELVHSQFQKFSKGEFKDRAMVRIKNSNGKFSIETTSEYARELIKAMAEKLGGDKSHVSGALISAIKLEGFSYEGVSSAIGIKKYQLDREMSGKEIVELCDNQPKAFFGLSFKSGEDELKIQAKSPKSAKGASSAKKEDEKARIDFCKLKTSDKNIVNGLVFEQDAKEFKKIEIKHDFVINEIIIPPELKNEKDFAVVREKSLRKGRIIRYLDIDGKKLKKEIEFEA
jgi:hypothetical protein